MSKTIVSGVDIMNAWSQTQGGVSLKTRENAIIDILRNAQHVLTRLFLV